MVSGIISLATTLASTFIGFAITQFLNGVILSSVISGILAYIPLFYIKEEYCFRVAVILAVGNFSSKLFGTLFAALIGASEVGQPLSSWRWFVFFQSRIFFVNMFTCAIASLVVKLRLPATIHLSDFLTPADRVLAQQRVKDANDPDAEDPDHQDFSMSAMAAAQRQKPTVFRKNFIFRSQQVWDWIQDSKFHLFAICVFFQSYAYASISSRTLVVTANVLELRNPSRAWFTVPSVTISIIPKTVALAITLFISKHSDTKGERAFHTAIPLLISSLLILLNAFVQDAFVRYLVLLFAEPALFSSFPLILSYALDYSHGETMKACVASSVASGIPLGPAVLHLMFPLVDTENQKQFSDWKIGNYDLPNDLAVWITASSSAAGAAILIVLIWWMNRREEAFSWAREPGLRRLMNDDEETHAWGEFGSNGDLLRDSPLPGEIFAKKRRKTEIVEEIPMKTAKMKDAAVENAKVDEDDDWN